MRNAMLKPAIPGSGRTLRYGVQAKHVRNAVESRKTFEQNQEILLSTLTTFA